MKPSDIRIKAVDITFQDEELAVPLRLSKGVIEKITYARVAVRAAKRDGQTATGHGAILLSDLWAFPTSEYSHEQKDTAMRALCSAFAHALTDDDAFGDPLQKGAHLERLLPELMRHVETKPGLLGQGAMPYLAGLNAMSPFDAAIHDVWGKLIGRPSYICYTANWLNDDLETYLGESFAGRYPHEFLRPRRQRLAVQHVVGVGDPLTPGEVDVTRRQASPVPLDLATWIRQDGVFAFKLKTRGVDGVEDAQRVADVYRVAAETLAAERSRQRVQLSIDPNEGCSHPDILLEMLDYLVANAPDALRGLNYIEQPTERDLSRYNFTLHDVAQRVPVIIDESLERLETLPTLEAQGWSGLAVKTCKGHTHSLLAYCWAKQQQSYVTLQDLTNPGMALVHSANFCSYLDLSVDYFECNHRQFMPESCRGEQERFPDYFHISFGYITLPEETMSGLY